MFALQAGNDSEALIDGYVEMLDKLTTTLRSAHHFYNPVFAELVLLLRSIRSNRCQFLSLHDAVPNLTA